MHEYRGPCVHLVGRRSSRDAPLTHDPPHSCTRDLALAHRQHYTALVPRQFYSIFSPAPLAPSRAPPAPHPRYTRTTVVPHPRPTRFPLTRHPTFFGSLRPFPLKWEGAGGGCYQTPPPYVCPRLHSLYRKLKSKD